jgi:hypothetical protein
MTNNDYQNNIPSYTKEEYSSINKMFELHDKMVSIGYDTITERSKQLNELADEELVTYNAAFNEILKIACEFNVPVRGTTEFKTLVVSLHEMYKYNLKSQPVNILKDVALTFVPCVAVMFCLRSLLCYYKLMLDTPNIIARWGMYSNKYRYVVFTNLEEVM